MNRDTFIKELQPYAAFPIVNAAQTSFLINDFYGFVNFTSSELPRVEIWLRVDSNDKAVIMECMNPNLNIKTIFYISKAVLNGIVHSSMSNCELRSKLKNESEENADYIEDEVLDIVKKYLLLCESKRIKKTVFNLSEEENLILNHLDTQYSDVPLNEKKGLISILLNAYRKSI